MSILEKIMRQPEYREVYAIDDARHGIIRQHILLLLIIKSEKPLYRSADQFADDNRTPLFSTKLVWEYCLRNKILKWYKDRVFSRAWLRQRLGNDYFEEKFSILPEEKEEPKTSAPRQEQRFALSENVFMTSKEIADLQSKLMPNELKKCIDRLSSFKSGFKAKTGREYCSDHNLIYTFFINKKAPNAHEEAKARQELYKNTHGGKTKEEYEAIIKSKPVKSIADIAKDLFEG